MLRSISRARPLALPDLPALPPLARWVLGAFLQPILATFEILLMRAVLARCAAHPLVQIAQTYDPAAVIAACAAYHHPEGTKGAPPTFTIEQLVRAEIVRAWANSCSDGELEWLLASNLLARHFVGLGLLVPTPDHSTLSRFHAWLTIHVPDALFCDVLTFLDRLDPEDAATTPQIVDTFAMASPAAPALSVASLLRHLTRRLALAWLAQAPASLQHALPPLDLSGLARTDAPRTPQLAQQHLQAAVTVASWLVDGLTPCLAALAEPFRATVASQLLSIRKVIADETSTDAEGLVQELCANAKGTYRIGSAVDLEATFRKHEGDPAVFGSNAVISTTATRIRAALILTGCTPDSQAPVAVLRQLQSWQQPLPPVLIMDQAGGMGKTRADVDAVSGGQTVMVARVPATAADGAGRLSAAAFVLSADGQTLMCPNGQASTRQYPHPTTDGVRFTFRSTQCRGCPLWDECRGPDSKPNVVRFVYVTAYHLYVRAAARFNQTDVGKALLTSRWQVEPTIAWLVRYQGCRLARRCGLAAARCQLLQACAVRNLLLWLSRTERQRQLT
jgi:Transposase DDE domain/Transposase domain (DUF772)